MATGQRSNVAVEGGESLPPEALRDRGLEPLADEIRRHHKAVERHARSMLDEAVAAGEKLIEAKGLLRHGEFGPWLTYCGLNRRTAQLYMKLAREKRNVAVLEAESIRGALEALDGKPKPKPKARPESWDWFFRSNRSAGDRSVWIAGSAPVPEIGDRYDFVGTNGSRTPYEVVFVDQAVVRLHREGSDGRFAQVWTGWLSEPPSSRPHWVKSEEVAE